VQTHHGSHGAILGWLASIGAGRAEDVAAGCGLGAAAVRARLSVLERGGFTQQARLLHGAPALHVLTRSGLREAGRPELGLVNVTAASFGHQVEVARVAAALAGEPGEIFGERALRALERAEGRPVASAEIGYDADGLVALHRPDLVCWGARRPVAIEVELTVKAPARLQAIVRGWARSRLVVGVVYYASPPAMRAVAAAVRREQAGDRVVLRPLEGVGPLPEFAPVPSPGAAWRQARAFDRRVPSQARRSVGLSTDSPTPRRP